MIVCAVLSIACYGATFLLARSDSFSDLPSYASVRGAKSKKEKQETDEQREKQIGIEISDS
jgi:hypothetical protein